MSQICANFISFLFYLTETRIRILFHPKYWHFHFILCSFPLQTIAIARHNERSKICDFTHPPPRNINMPKNMSQMVTHYIKPHVIVFKYCIRTHTRTHHHVFIFLQKNCRSSWFCIHLKTGKKKERNNWKQNNQMAIHWRCL